MTRWTRGGVAVALASALLLAGCGDDDDAGDGADDTTTTAEADDTTTTEAGMDGEVVEVEAKDYEFVGLPESVPAGTRFSLRNTSQAELHELVAIRIPDSETRPVSELVQLSEEELDALFGSAPPATVILSLPGQADTPGAVEGDGSIGEAGRYAVICAIPTGADPQAYIEAAQAAPGGPPDIPGGPPHFVQGMFAEVTVG